MFPLKSFKGGHLLTVAAASEGPGTCTRGPGQNGDSAVLTELRQAVFRAERERERLSCPTPSPPPPLAQSLTLLSAYPSSIAGVLASQSPS